MSGDTFGRRLRSVLQTIDPAMVESQLGVSQSTVNRLLRDAHAPSAEVLTSLSRLGWSASWLLTGEGNPRIDSVPARAPIPARAIALAQLSIDCFRADLQAALLEGAARVIPTVMLRACVLADAAGEPIAAHHVTQAWADIGGDA